AGGNAPPRRGRAPNDADRAERAFLATEPELAGLAASSATSEPPAGCLMEGDPEPISLLPCSLEPVRSTTSTSIRPAAIGDQKLQHLTDRSLPADGLPQRQMNLDLIAIATAVLVLHHVASRGRVRDDAAGRPLGDAPCGG